MIKEPNTAITHEAIIEEGPNKSKSVAMVLVESLLNNQRDLDVDGLPWISHISEEELNHLRDRLLSLSHISEVELNRIHKGERKGKSMAYYLAAESLGRALLAHDDFAFGSQITAETLNHIIEEGPNKGESIAYCLAATPEGRALLAHDDFALGSQITVETLNHIIEEGPNKGKSVAYCLAAISEGRALLVRNGFALASQISRETLNHIIEVGPKKGESVAYCLVASPVGLVFLAHNGFPLALPGGQAFLAHNDYALGLQISADTMNHIIEEGPNKGESIAYWLAATPEGRALLARNDYTLGKSIINRAGRAPGFDVGPRYFEDPETLKQFMLKFPDRRGEMKSEAPNHIERLQGYLGLTGTCKSLNPKHCESEAAKVQSNQGVSENIEMNLSELNTKEQEAFVNLSESLGLCLFPEVSSDALPSCTPPGKCG
ncbi:MAG: hypothetical protein VX737_04020 [Pseudomonadota bacterium]|nr:hypothetical protein [Pseudomonadota bacterium]